MDDKLELIIYSEEVRDVLSEPPRSLYRWGNTVMLAFMGILLILSCIIKYPDIIQAPVIVTTQKPPEKVVARSTGSIEAIFIHDRQNVQNNQYLAVIQNPADYKDVFYLKEIIDSVKIDSNGIEFPLNKVNKLQLGDISESMTLFQKDYLIFKLNKELAPYKVENKAQQNEVKELKKRLRLMFEQKAYKESQLNIDQKQLNRWEVLYENGAISTQEWESQRSIHLEEQKELSQLNIQLSQLQSSIIDIYRQVDSSMITEEMDNQTFERDAIQSFNNLKKAIANHILKYVLASSIEGEVSFLQIWAENQFVKEGEIIFTIVPRNNSNYIGKIEAESTNSGKLAIGQKVYVELANYPYREYGVIEGQVKSISLTPNSDGRYLIYISLPKELITSYGKKIRFQQEMIGNAKIITEELRLIERLFYQIREILHRK